jgi:hypothetical protein
VARMRLSKDLSFVSYTRCMSVRSCWCACRMRTTSCCSIFTVLCVALPCSPKLSKRLLCSSKPRRLHISCRSVVYLDLEANHP